MKGLLLLVLVLAGCGGGGGVASAPAGFDGEWIGTQEPAGVTPFVQFQVKGVEITGGHVTEQDKFVDWAKGTLAPDGTFKVQFDPEASGTFVLEGRHMRGGPFSLLRLR